MKRKCKRPKYISNIWVVSVEDKFGSRGVVLCLGLSKAGWVLGWYGSGGPIGYFAPVYFLIKK